jgi:putative chitinase
MNQLQLFQKQHCLDPDGIMGKNTLRKMKEVFFISSNAKIAHFVGQMSHESMGFTASVENLNYSESALLKVFRKYFSRETAAIYARQPERIANKVYANRMGNGNEASGDGWKHRGRGPLQITGYNNQEQFANKMQDLQILANPTLISEKYYFDSALFFFDENNLWHLCEEVNNQSIIDLTKRINGGVNGLQDRIYLTNKYYGML